MLYLDADNIALTDPADLFQSVDYLRTGALLWPDFWAPSPAPDLDAILRLARAEQPGEPAVEQPLRGAWNGTVETGQMVINKSTAWRGLSVTLFLNLQARRFLSTRCSGWVLCCSKLVHPTTCRGACTTDC